MLLYQPAEPVPFSEGPRSNETPIVSASLPPKVAAIRAERPKPEEAPSMSTRFGPLVRFFVGFYEVYLLLYGMLTSFRMGSFCHNAFNYGLYYH